jgi:NhaP-type Na+/H+ or K+/H+ antiporter
VSDWLPDRAGGFLVSEGSVGYGFRKLLRFSHDRGLADRESFVAQYLALALFTIGVASSLGMDDLLAAFATGT